MKIGDDHFNALVRLLEVEREYLDASGWHPIGNGRWSKGTHLQEWPQSSAVLAQRTKDRNDLRAMGFEEEK